MITGQKIALRAIEPTDADLYWEWINDPETNYWRGLYQPTSEQQAKRWIDDQSIPQPDRLTLAITIASSGRPGPLLGFVGLRSICARSRRAEVWIYIGAKDNWSKGFGTEAIQLICDHAFHQMNLFRIWLECDPGYQAGARCYEKVGFVREGILRKGHYRHGAFRDTCIMSYLKDDWEAAKTKSK